MIELYGNKIWNSNTPNKYKKVIIANEDSLDNICQKLENSGLNYCAYIFNGKAHIAIGRATATNIDKLDIDYQAVIDCNSKIYKTNNIIGTTTYDSIEDKLYRKYNTDFAYKIGQRLTEQGILFSGRIYGKTTTITVDKQYADTLNKISAELKEQRTSFMSKSENDLQEEVKSVDEKISELHFNELQLSALESAISFVNDRNDDTLTDTLLSLFSDCTDFNETQISALAKNYVDTYRKFSGTSLIFADISKFTDLKQHFANDNITARLTENRGYSNAQLDIIRDMVAYGMSDSVINLLDYTFSIDEMQNFFTAYKNGSYEDLINLIADIKGTTRTDIEGQIEGGTYTPEIPDYDFLSKNLIFHNPSANHFTVMYFNPDSETGGQFVSTDINYNVAWRGNRDFTNDSERFWRYVEITGNQTLSDVGSKFFRESLNYFYSGEQIAEGLTTDTQKLIADVDQAALTYSEIKALCTGDERIREKLTLENQVKELQALKSEYSSTKYELEDKVNAYPEARKKLLMDIGNVSKDLETVKSIPYNTKDGNYQVEITLGADTYSLRDEEARKAATKALTNAFAQVKGDANKNKRVNIGQLANFGIEVINDGYFFDKITATLRGNYAYSVELGVSNPVNLKKIENLLFKVENVLNDKKSELNKLDIDYKTAQNMLNKPFEFEDELNSSTKRLDELTTALNIEMSEQHKSADKPKKTHYFGKDKILGRNKSSKQLQNKAVMKSEPKRSEQEL